jgi:hypothetical protein
MRARLSGIGLALAVGGVAYAVAGACIYWPTPAAFRFFAFARSLNAGDPIAAAEFMLRTVPRNATSVLLISVAAAVLLFFATGRRNIAPAARYALYVLVVGDLLVHAWGINPAFDRAYFAEPGWIFLTKAQPDSRFYVGGKVEGTLDSGDPDSSRAFLNPAGLSGSASRAALNIQAGFAPSAWHAREMLTDDLPILWPRTFALATKRFLSSGREDRDRFLDRTAVRYRILPERLAAPRPQLHRCRISSSRRCSTGAVTWRNASRWFPTPGLSRRSRCRSRRCSRPAGTRARRWCWSVSPPPPATWEHPCRRRRGSSRTGRIGSS